MQEEMTLVNSIELPISHTYVHNWTIYEGLREIFQNAIDRNNEGYEMFHNYNEDEKILYVSNDDTTLEVKTLILGNSNKTNNDEAIGKFGEGYKLALLVILRNGLEIEIVNGEYIWIPRLKYSEKYDTKILFVDIFENPDKEPTGILIFKIKGLRKRVYNSYHRYNLLLQKKYNSEETSKGEILYDERHKGKVFVEGLYITTIPEEFYFGYNFKAGVMPLDRDRMKLSSFDVAWESEALHRELTPTRSEEVVKLLEEGARDVQYLLSKGEGSEEVKELAVLCYKRFKERYGEAIPVESEYEKTQMKKDYEDVRCKVVAKRVYEACKLSDEYKLDMQRRTKRTRITPEEVCVKFLADNKEYFPLSLLQKYIEIIIQKSREWRLE